MEGVPDCPMRTDGLVYQNCIRFETTDIQPALFQLRLPALVVTLRFYFYQGTQVLPILPVLYQRQVINNRTTSRLNPSVTAINIFGNGGGGQKTETSLSDNISPKGRISELSRKGKLPGSERKSMHAQEKSSISLLRLKDFSRIFRNVALAG